jgi:tryptophan synthase alpha chain
VGRIEDTFAALSAKKRKALVAYLCMGDPSIEESVDLALACVDAGADMLELGVPFSDPTADGAAIARASQRAIANGGGLEATLRAAKAIRAKTNVPLVLFGYYNPLFVRGDARVANDAADAGIDAMLVVDLPPEEGDLLRDTAAKRGLTIVPLLAPTSSPARLDAVRRRPRSFIYYVSVTGVTGSAAAPLEEASRKAGELRSLGSPVVVGFGIDSADKARAAAKHADGVVAGTAIVRAIEDGKSPEERKRAVSDLVRALRAGVDSP